MLGVFDSQNVHFKMQYIFTILAKMHLIFIKPSKPQHFLIWVLFVYEPIEQILQDYPIKQINISLM